MATKSSIKYEYIGDCPECGSKGITQTYRGMYQDGAIVQCSNMNCPEKGCIVFDDSESAGHVEWN